MFIMPKKNPGGMGAGPLAASKEETTCFTKYSAISQTFCPRISVQIRP